MARHKKHYEKKGRQRKKTKKKQATNVRDKITRSRGLYIDLYDVHRRDTFTMLDCTNFAMAESQMCEKVT